MNQACLGRLLAGILLIGTGSGCASVAFFAHKVPMSFIYSDSSTNEMVTDAKFGTKMGKGCAKSYLGWVTLGDASVSTASKAAGITEIASVDHTYKDILGIYAEYCVLVSGE